MLRIYRKDILYLLKLLKNTKGEKMYFIWIVRDIF